MDFNQNRKLAPLALVAAVAAISYSTYRREQLVKQSRANHSANINNANESLNGGRAPPPPPLSTEPSRSPTSQEEEKTVVTPTRPSLSAVVQLVHAWLFPTRAHKREDLAPDKESDEVVLRTSEVLEMPSVLRTAKDDRNAANNNNNNNRSSQGGASNPLQDSPPRCESISSTTETSIRVSREAVEAEYPSGRRDRLLASRTMVQVGDLTVRIGRGFVEEGSSARFPVDCHRFVHQDGSRLCVLAEQLCSMRETITTEAYTQRSLDRVEAAAEEVKTFFRLKARTEARKIVTTVMEVYVNFHIGPSPIIVVAFFLVRGGMAYSIELQCLADDYENRLADVLACVQSARLLGPSDSPVPRGSNVLTVSDDDSQRSYEVYIPPQFAVSTDSDGRLRLELHHTTAWWGILTTREDPIDMEERRVVALLPGKVFLHSLADEEDFTAADRKELQALLASELCFAKELQSKPVDLHCYISTDLNVPLPDLTVYEVNVCEHSADAFVTLFIKPKVRMDFTYEMELRTVAILDENRESFMLYLESFFLTAVPPSFTRSAAGVERISAEGIAANVSDSMLVIEAVHLGDSDYWLVVRWMYSGCDPLPRNLDNYTQHLLEGITVS